MTRRIPMCRSAPTTGSLFWRKPVGQMSVRMEDIEIGNSWLPIGIEGGVDALYELVPEDMHPSDPILSSNLLIG